MPATPPPELLTPIAPDPSDPGNWREIDRLRKLAEFEGRVFDPNDPYNWKGIAATGDNPGNTTTVNTPGVTGVDSTPGTADTVTASNRAVFDVIANLITQSGLSGLFSVTADGAPAGRLWDYIVANPGVSQQGLIAWFETQPEFQARFPVIAQIRQNGAANGVTIVPTPGQVREFETRVSSAMRQAGLPDWFYDDPLEVQALMGSGMAAPEIEARLGAAWSTVRETDSTVLQAFSDFYGVSGDAAMAAFFLDPERTMASIDRASRAAYTAGMGRTVGLSLDRAVAERAASLPMTEAGLWEGIRNVAELNSSGGVFDESFTERQDLSAEREGINGVLFGDGQALADIERRRIERSANSRSSLGGAAVTQAGAVGVSR